MSFVGRLVARVNGTTVPDGFTGKLDDTEHVLGAAELGERVLVATSLGLWVPTDDGHRRIGWHQISKAGWDDPVLTVTESRVTATVAGAELLEDGAPQRFSLTMPGRVPRVVAPRVEGTFAARHHRDLPGGGVWFLQRRVPGRDGTVLQVRADAGTDPVTVRRLVTTVVHRLEP